MSKRSAETYVSDDGFVEDDSVSPPPQNKRSKPAQFASAASLGVSGTGAPQKDENGDQYWDLNSSGTRRVTLNKFRGKFLVNVREYYEANGKKLPGKKGLSMPIEQFSALVKLLPQLEASLAEKGEKIPRPDYDDAGGAPEYDKKKKKQSALSDGEEKNSLKPSDENDGEESGDDD